MVSPPKKSRLKKRVIFSFITLMVLFLGGIYFALGTPWLIDFAMRRVNNVIPGKITYQSLRLEPARRTLKARSVKYENAQGETAVSFDSLALTFTFRGLLKGSLEIKDLALQGLNVDFRQFPKKESKVPTQWRTVVQIISKRLSIESSRIYPINAVLADGKKLHLDELKIWINPQVLQNQKFRMEISGSEVELGEMKVSTGYLKFDGEVDIPVIREYFFFVSEAKGHLQVDKIVYPNVPSSTLSTDFKIKGNELSIQKGKVENLYGILDLDLDYDPEKDTLDLELKNDRPIPFTILPKTNENLLTTFIGFKVDLKADLKGLSLNEVTGPIEMVFDAVGNKSATQTPDHKLTLKGNLNKGNLTFKLFQIVSEKMDLQATGSVNFPKQSFDVKIETNNFDVTTQVNAVADLDLTGYADATGTVRGTFTDPEIIMDVQAKETGYKFLNFGKTHGTFKIQNGNLSYEGGSPSGTEYVTQVKVMVKELFEKSRQTFLDASFKNLDAGPLLENPEIQGKVGGTFNLEIPGPDREKGVLKAKIDNFEVYDFHFTEIEVEGNLGNNIFTLDPVVFQPPDYDKITMSQPTVFKFDDKGWSFAGEIFPSLTLEGKFSESNPNYVEVKADLKNTKLQPILAAMLVPPQEATATGEVTLKIGLDDKPSAIDLKFSRFFLPLEDGDITNEGDVEILIRPPKMEFKQMTFKSGGEKFSMKGTYTLNGPLNLDLDGKLNLALVKFVPQMFRDGSGYANLDLKIGGSMEKPKVLGDITFSEANLVLRPIRANIEDMTGTLKFTGDAIVFDRLGGLVREGNLLVNGRVDLKNFKPSFYDLSIDTREVAIADPGVYKVIFSGNLKLKGPPGKAELAGNIDINDGVYTQDFSITEFIIRPQSAELPEPPSTFLQDIVLNLAIKSPGNLEINNNIAKMQFNADIKATGSPVNPKISGALEVLSGKFNYLTISFDDANGIIDFRNPKKGPYVDVTASKEFQTTTTTTLVQAEIKGFTENLQLNFTSSPPLSRRDIISLVFTGALSGSGGSPASLATGVLASQLGGPLAKRAKLDILRLEASDRTRSDSLTSLVVGKRLSDRLTLEFRTDLGVDQPTQGVQAEYLLLDNVLLKGTQLSDGEFFFNLAWRFKLN